MSKIIVTGGAGFIGSHLVDAYLDSGHDVSVIDDLSTGRRENLNPRASFYEMSITDQGLDEVFAEERPDLVNHHAAQVNLRASISDPAADASVNVLGTLRVLEAAKRAGCQRIVFASTGGAIYGEQERFPADEAHPVRPLSPYGIAKLSAEHYLRFYEATHGMTAAILRYANVYGPRQDPHGEAGVVAIFASRMLEGKQVTINGDGTQTRDFVYVADVVSANMAASALSRGLVANVGTGVETPINELFSLLKEIIGFEHTKLHGPPVPGEQRRSCIDPTFAKAALKWRPRYSLQDGLRQTVDYFRAK